MGCSAKVAVAAVELGTNVQLVYLPVYFSTSMLGVASAVRTSGQYMAKMGMMLECSTGELLVRAVFNGCMNPP